MFFLEGVYLISYKKKLLFHNLFHVFSLIFPWFVIVDVFFIKGLELKHWKEMVENPRRPIVHWHVLKVGHCSMLVLSL